MLLLLHVQRSHLLLLDGCKILLYLCKLALQLHDLLRE